MVVGNHPGERHDTVLEERKKKCLLILSDGGNYIHDIDMQSLTLAWQRCHQHIQYSDLGLPHVVSHHCIPSRLHDCAACSWSFLLASWEPVWHYTSRSTYTCSKPSLSLHTASMYYLCSRNHPSSSPYPLLCSLTPLTLPWWSTDRSARSAFRFLDEEK